MNTAEKKVLRIAIFLFAVGLIVRYLPWGLPAVDSVDIGDRPVPSVSAHPPSKLEYAAAPPAAEAHTPVLDTLFTDKVIERRGAEHPKKSRKKKKIVHFPLKINDATADELCALKGVGPKLAEKIIAFREAHGPFAGPASLQKVPGIGKKKLEGILPWVIFD